MKFAWGLWLYGLIYGAIGAAAGAASNFVVLPTQIDHLTMKKMFVIAGWNALVAGSLSALFYLKTHPLPSWDGTDRRNTVPPPPPAA